MEQVMIGNIRSLIEKIGVPIVDIRHEEDVQGGVLFVVETKDNWILIGEEGNRLQALNHLAKQIAIKNGLPTTFHIDIGGFAAAHKRKLSDTAKIFSERARYFKSPVHMEPMNPYDRLIVHAALTHLSDISTQSEGVGMNRHVVISYKGNDDSHSI
jgi:spoIIIJ-associated protein